MDWQGQNVNTGEFRLAEAVLHEVRNGRRTLTFREWMSLLGVFFVALSAVVGVATAYFATKAEAALDAARDAEARARIIEQHNDDTRELLDRIHAVDTKRRR